MNSQDIISEGVPMIYLKDIDDKTLDDLLALAMSEATPEEVMPPVSAPAGWNETRKAAFRMFHESRRDGLEGPHAEVTFAILQDGRVVGSGRLARVRPGVLETGMWLARSARGCGIGSKALLTLAEQAAATGTTRLIARTTTANLGALGALRNCGADIGEPDPQGKVEAEIPL